MRLPVITARGTILVVSVLALYLLLAGCGRAAVATDGEPTSVPPPLPTPSATPLVTHLPDAGATKIAMVATEMAAQATAGARYTPVLPLTPETRPTEIPALTPILGFPDECGDVDNRFNYGGCYTALLNNEYVFVQIGGPQADLSQGLLRVYTSTLDQRTRSPWQEYPTPRQEGLISSAQFVDEHLSVIALHDSAPVSEFRFNLLTRTWEDLGACQLYPIALHIRSLQGLPAWHGLVDAANGVSDSSFGWLSWRGDITDPALAVSLTAPGDSSTYINPNNPADHALSIGDWIVGRPAVNNDSAVAATLSKLARSYFRVVVPVWDQAAVQGDRLSYHVTGFAWIQMVEHNLTNPNHLTVHYWGPAICPDNP